MFFIIVGDVNTPPSCKAAVDTLDAAGFSAIYLTVEHQNEFLEPFPRLRQHIPFHSDSRRNVGYLWALAKGFDVVLSMDDDNYPVACFPGQHANTGSECKHASVRSDSGWYNCMEMLAIRPQGIGIYPRGFPYKARKPDKYSQAITCGRVAATAGLWLGDPDVDAVTRLAIAPTAEKLVSSSVALARGTRCPINTQNTSVMRDAMVSYFFPAPRAKVNGHSVRRFGDIFSGYFLQMCAEAVGDFVTIGEPLVEQVRNEHNLFDDLAGELPGIRLVEHLTCLIQTPLDSTQCYKAAYSQIINKIRKEAYSDPPGLSGGAEFFAELGDAMEAWAQAVEVLSCGVSNNVESF